VTVTEGPVTRADIEAKLRQIKGGVDQATTTVRPYLAAGVAALAVVGLGMAFMLGRRQGKKKTTVVEVRRV
jgi:hypothetical protein